MTTRPPMQCRNALHGPIDLYDGADCPICNPNQYEDDVDILARTSDHDPYHKVTGDHDQLRRDGQRWAAGLYNRSDRLFAAVIAAELNTDINPERRAFCEGVKIGLEQGYRGLVADNGQGGAA
jgi:hypothetical protein